MIEYVCPQCGGEVSLSLLTSLPPIMRFECTRCDYRHEEREGVQKVVAPGGNPTVKPHVCRFCGAKTDFLDRQGEPACGTHGGRYVGRRP